MAITKEQVKELQQAIGTACWKMGLDQFADAIGSDPEHDYTRDKFRQFQVLGKALGQFDAETLTRILNHGGI